MKTDQDSWALIKTIEHFVSDKLSAEEILKLYCDEIDSGCASRITKLRARVDLWRETYYPVPEKPEM